jgi:hypothetical protein
MQFFSTDVYKECLTSLPQLQKVISEVILGEKRYINRGRALDGYKAMGRKSCF